MKERQTKVRHGLDKNTPVSLLDRLDEYKHKKEEQKIKKIQVLNKNQGLLKRGNEFPKKQEPVAKRKRESSTTETIPMKEKLEQWRAKQKENINLSTVQRRKTIGWTLPGKLDQLKHESGLSTTKNRRTTLLSTTAGNLQKSVFPRNKTIGAKLPLDKNKRLPANQQGLYKTLTLPEKRHIKNTAVESKRILSQKSVSSSTPAFRPSSSNFSSSTKALAASTLSAIKSVSESLRKRQNGDQSQNAIKLHASSHPKSRKSLFGADKFQIQTDKAIGRPLHENIKRPKLSNVSQSARLRTNTPGKVLQKKDLINKDKPPKTPGRKFVHVSSRIDTGLRTTKTVKPEATTIDKPKQQSVVPRNKQAPTIKMTKTVAQRLNNLNKASSNLQTGAWSGHMNLQNKPYSLTTRRTSSSSSVSTRRGLTSSEQLLNANKVRPVEARKSESCVSNMSDVRQSTRLAMKPRPTGILVKKGIITKNTIVLKDKVIQMSCLAKQKLGISETNSDSDNEAVTDRLSKTSDIDLKHKVRFVPTTETASAMKKQLSKTPVKGTPKSIDSVIMRERLNDWLSSKGKTPSKFMHLMCFHADQNSNEKVEGGLTVNELHLQQEQLQLEEEGNDSVFETSLHSLPQTPKINRLNNLLNECLLLLQSGCPVENVSEWLTEIQKSYPSVIKEAKYYILMSNFAEQRNATNAEIIDIFEEAVRNNAAPPDEVASALTEFVSRMNTRKSEVEPSLGCTPPKTPRKDRQTILEENIITSSTTKYSLSKTTPFFTRLRAKADGLPTPCGIVTPVRRSARLSKTPLPSALQDCDRIIETLDELSPDTRQHLLFQSNKALLSEFEAVVENTPSPCQVVTRINN